MTPLPTAAQASFVCVACRQRKRACDKRIPHCTYCARRSLRCEYTAIPPSKTREKQFTIVHTPPTPEHDPQPTSFGRFEDLFSAIVDGLDDAMDQYFNGLHVWLPFLSQAELKHGLQIQSVDPTTHFGFLLVTTYMVGKLPSVSMPSQRDLYCAVKTQMVQLQISGQPSLDLIRAFIVVSMYEYATRDCANALMTLSTAIRAACEIGIDEQIRRIQTTPVTPQAVFEIWWVLIICERLYVLECRNPYQALLTALPNLTQNARELTIPSAHLEHAWKDYFTREPGLGHTAHAAVLLDNVLRTARRRHRREQMSNELCDLDAELRHFLGVVLKKCEGTWGTYCGAIATALRALFVLHKPALYHQPVEARTADANTSRAALDTATTIMTDISVSHLGTLSILNIDALPPTCIYVLTEALEHVKYYQSDDCSRDPSRPLRSFLQTYLQRWHNGMQEML